MPFLRFSVPLDYTKNERIDKYIANLPDGMNRSKLKSGMNQILINDKNAKLSQKIKAGDKIDISWDDNVPDDIRFDSYQSYGYELRLIRLYNKSLQSQDIL